MYRDLVGRVSRNMNKTRHWRQYNGPMAMNLRLLNPSSTTKITETHYGVGESLYLYSTHAIYQIRDDHNTTKGFVRTAKHMGASKSRTPSLTPIHEIKNCYYDFPTRCRRAQHPNSRCTSLRQAAAQHHAITWVSVAPPQDAYRARYPRSATSAAPLPEPRSGCCQQKVSTVIHIAPTVRPQVLKPSFVASYV